MTFKETLIDRLVSLCVKENKQMCAITVEMFNIIYTPKSATSLKKTIHPAGDFLLNVTSTSTSFSLQM